MSDNCRFVGSCIQCDGRPAVPPRPPSYTESVEAAWGGARSIDQLDGSLYLEFGTRRPVGAVLCGLGDLSRYQVGDPSSVRHGIIVTTVNNFSFWQRWENGAPVGSPTQWVSDEILTCKIARFGNAVFYRVSDTVTLWTGQYTALSQGMQVTLGCLYATGDTIL